MPIAFPHSDFAIGRSTQTIGRSVRVGERARFAIDRAFSAMEWDVPTTGRDVATIGRDASATGREVSAIDRDVPTIAREVFATRRAVREIHLFPKTTPLTWGRLHKPARRLPATLTFLHEADSERIWKDKAPLRFGKRAMEAKDGVAALAEFCEAQASQIRRQSSRLTVRSNS